MNITNSQLFPSVFIEAITNLNKNAEDRSSFDYSATSLIRTPREVILTKRHRNEIVPDAHRLWYTFTGTAFHEQLEKGLKDNPRYVLEHRFVVTDEIEIGGNKYTVTVGFKPDNYDKETCTLYDYKETTTYIHGLEAKKEWEQQLNLYARILELHGFPVKAIKALVIYRDWRKASGQYKTEEEYPQSPVAEFDVPLWTKQQQDDYYRWRLQEMIKYTDTPDDELPECSSEDTWEKPSVFAIYKPGATKSRRNVYSIEDADAYIRQNKLIDHRVEHRPGRRTKCEQYCDAAPFCNQFQNWKKQQENNDVKSLAF